MNIYHVDHMQVWTGDKGTVPDKSKDPIPRGWIATNDVPGKGIQRWQGRWVTLDKYPEAPPPAPEPGEKSKEDYVAELEARKEKAALLALIDERIAASAATVKEK